MIQIHRNGQRSEFTGGKKRQEKETKIYYLLMSDRFFLCLSLFNLISDYMMLDVLLPFGDEKIKVQKG